MKKIKQVLSFVLILAISVAGLPLASLSTQAETVTSTKYSDILFAYSDYLNDSEYLNTYIQETQGVFDRVYTDYLDSADYIAMTFKESLLKSVNLVDWLQTMGSALGLNNYVYENALASANELLVNHLLSATQNTMVDTMGACGEWAEKISGLCELYEKYDEWASSANATDTEKLNESFNLLYESGILKKVTESDVKALQNFVIENETASQMLSSVGDILKAGKALMIALVMEDMRVYTVDCIMKYSPKGALYDGMHVLEWQLSNGFVSYFAENFLKGELLTKISDDVVDQVLSYAMGSATAFSVVKLIVEVSVFVVFDCIFNVDSLDDLTTQRIITEYAYDCSNVIMSAKSIFAEQFTIEEVQEYQNLYAVLRALTDASFEASEVISLPENSVNLRFYKQKYQEDNIFDKTIDDVKEIVDNIPVSERKRTFYEEWRIEKNATAKISSDTLKDSEMYFPEGEFYGKVLVVNETKKLTVPKDVSITIEGDLHLWRSVGSYIEGDADLIIDGEVEVTGTVCPSTFGFERIINNGILKLHKNAYCDIESYGDIYFCGTEQQFITNDFEANNVYVENEKGLKYYSSPKIKGKFVLNNNPIENNTYSTFIYDGFYGDSVSDYKAITVPEDFELTFDITADFTVSTLKKLIIPENKDVKINGNVHLYGSTTDYSTSIVNYGNAEITGDITQTFGNSIVNDGILKVGGDCTGYISGLGTLVFNGNHRQQVYVYRDAHLIYDISKVVLENESNQGVIFWYHINFTELFDHNGNNYQLYEYGSKTTFVDYDGDDMADNIDPVPTEFDDAYYYCSKHGDVNTDEKVNVIDLIKLKKAVSKGEKDDIYNINKDDGVNSLDMSLIRRFLLVDYKSLLKK